MIPVNEPLIGKKESIYVNECLKTGWISSGGKFITEFEETFATYINKKYGIAVNNGTNALILAFRVLDLPAESEVIIPTFTIISCALACIYNNLKPVLVDCEPDTWNMDVGQIEEKITDKTKAIMAVHIYGHPADMDSLIGITKKYNLYIIEDAAEAIGAEYKGQKCGSFGDLSCFSFYANKTITTGEGGMVLTDDDKLAEKLRLLRNLGFISQRRFYHEELGYNFRMTNIQAAIGLAQLERIEEHINIKRKIGKLYTELLKDISYLQLPVEKEWAKNIYWMYGIVLDEKKRLDAVGFGKKLLRNGIQTRPFFLGMHEQPAFHKMGLFINEHYPVAERIAKQGLYLPSGLTLKEEEIKKMAKVMEKITRKVKCVNARFKTSKSESSEKSDSR